MRVQTEFCARQRKCGKYTRKPTNFGVFHGKFEKLRNLTKCKFFSRTEAPDLECGKYILFNLTSSIPPKSRSKVPVKVSLQPLFSHCKLEKYTRFASNFGIGHCMCEQCTRLANYSHAPGQRPLLEHWWAESRMRVQTEFCARQRKCGKYTRKPTNFGVFHGKFENCVI